MAMLRSVLQSFCDPVTCAGLGGTGRPKRYGVIGIGQPFRLIGPNVGAQMVQKGGCESGAKLRAEIGLLFEVCDHLNLSKRRCIGLRVSSTTGLGFKAGDGFGFGYLDKRGGAVCSATAFMNLDPSPEARCAAPFPMPLSKAANQS
jgi:hypothetical protein